MSQELYTVVDNFLSASLAPPDTVLDAVLKSHLDAGLPPIAVTPTLGKFLNLIARSIGAKKILEIGTLGGYSTIWLARALPPTGRLITLEFDPKHAEVARKNFQRAGLEDVIEIHIGKALATLPQFAVVHSAPFVPNFLDANKQTNSNYPAWALQPPRPGKVILTNNVVRDGPNLDSATASPD